MAIKKKTEGSMAAEGKGNKSVQSARKERRAKNVKKINLKVPVIVTSVLCVLFFVGGGAIAFWGGGSYVFEKSITVTVASPDDIIKLGKSISNDNIKLANDIHITNASFSVGGEAYSGVFDGCGHTVYFDYNTGNETTSFFSAIGKSGVVKNTRFVFTNVNVEGGFFSGVSKINYGTMQDCVVEYNLLFNAKEGAYTPFVNVNYGSIKNIVTSGTFTYDVLSVEEQSEDGTPVDDTSAEKEKESEDDTSVTPSPDEGEGEGEGGAEKPDEGEDETPEIPEKDDGKSIHSGIKNEDEKKIAFAGVCVYNFGELKNVISTPRYVGFYCTFRENYLAGRSENVAIASVCSFVGAQGIDGKIPTEQGLVSINEKTLYTSDDVRLDIYENFSDLIRDAEGALIKTLIENKYDFNNNIWEIDETELCLKLKIN